jgi:hypothetical protein
VHAIVGYFDMRIVTSRSASLLAIAAAFSLTASPALARGWGGYGGHHRHHNRGIDGGDVLAGVLILGGIAAIASAASKSSQQKRDRDYRYPDARYPENRDDGADYRSDEDEGAGSYGRGPSDGQRGSDAVNAAIDSCASEIEHGERRIEAIDAVRRSGEGWSVEGQVSGGRGFACDVGSNGRIRSATVDGKAV